MDNSTNTVVQESQTRNYNIFTITQDGEESYAISNEDEFVQEHKEEIMEALTSVRGQINERIARDSHEELITKMLSVRDAKIYRQRLQRLIDEGVSKEDATENVLQLRENLEVGGIPELSDEEQKTINESDAEIEKIGVDKRETVDLYGKYETLNSMKIEKENETIEIRVKNSIELEIKVTKMKDPDTISKLNAIDKERGKEVIEAEYTEVEEPKQIEGQEPLSLGDGNEKNDIEDDDFII